METEVNQGKVDWRIERYYLFEQRVEPPVCHIGEEIGIGFWRSLWGIASRRLLLRGGSFISGGRPLVAQFFLRFLQWRLCMEILEDAGTSMTQIERTLVCQKRNGSENDRNHEVTNEEPQ